MDIVEQLRSDAEDIGLLKTEETDKIRQKYKVYGTMIEAADEIERLRERLKRANENHEHFQREWYLRGDKIERLRDELQRIADVSERWEDSLVSQINEMAHKALGEKSDHPA